MRETSITAVTAAPGSVSLPLHAIRMTRRQHARLRQHLFPGDGCEAVALVLCGRLAAPSTAERPGDDDAGEILTIFRIEPVPHERCIERTPERVRWPTDLLPRLLEDAAKRGFTVLKIHSHPGNLRRFSWIDDDSDRELVAAVGAWLDDERLHASAVMLPDGRIFARSVAPDGTFSPISKVAVAGEEIMSWRHADVVETDASSNGAGHSGGRAVGDVPEFARRTKQAFGAGTTAMLSQMSVAVVGCSGTGSPTIEMLARLGVRRLVLVDPDRVEEKNLNRIFNATMADARREEFKVDVLARAIKAMGLGTVVDPIASDLFAPDVVRRVARCDVVFGCMDSVDGRELLNRLAAFYLVPYIDVGVRLVADGRGGVDQICGTVHYLQPDGSSLLSRSAYTAEDVRAAATRRENPAKYEALRREKYISGVQEDRPAVISVNTLYASLAVNELLARLQPYRDEGNASFASYGMSLTQGRLLNGGDGPQCPALSRHAGRADVRPLLNMPELTETRTPA